MKALLVSMAALSLGGCASSFYEGEYAWDDGWRAAKVVRVGAAPDLGGRHSTDCRYEMTQEQLATFDRFVVVSFSQMSRQRRGVVPLAAGAADPRPGDLVYANVRRCDEARLEPRRDPPKV